ncbi:MAG: beta-aspartyl-peptidase [Pseudomonadota bacterium]
MYTSRLFCLIDRMLLKLSNANVYAPEPLQICDLLVAGGQIVWLGKPGSAPVTAAVESVDLEGRRLLPGFIDGHAHLTGGGGESGFSSRVPPVPLSRFTAAGVTSVVGVLGTDDITRDTAGLVAAAYALREEGIGAWCHCGGYHVPPVTLTGRVRRDIVYVDPIIGVGEVAVSDHRSSQPTLDELLKLASEAHVAGIMTGKAGILHLHLGDGDRGLELVREALKTSELPPRVFNPTHVNRKPELFEEALALARTGSTIDVTAYDVADKDPSIPAAVALSRYLESDAPADRITVSSDGGGCLPEFDADGVLTRMEIGHPGSLPDTLAELLRAGVPLADALPAFTSNVAALLRLKDRGRIRAGARADFVVFDDEHRISEVMAGGVWHVKNGTQQVSGTFE